MYPTLHERYTAPKLLVPAFYLIFAFTPVVRTTASRVSILILLVTLASISPYFHDQNLNNDYGRGLPSFTLPILFLDLFLLSPPGTVKIIGSLEDVHDQNAGLSENDCDTLWKKLKWGLRLVASSRGIGWTWQVKGVPTHPDRHLTRWRFVLKYLVLSSLSWIYTTALHYLMGICIAGRANTTSPYAHAAFNILEGWSGAFWGCVGLNQFYQLAAAVSAGLGLCDPWEWPPFFGNLRDGWSVRQIWSSVWHQLLRRIFQEPGIRLARLMGAPKGTNISSYIQLYTAFTLSWLLHKWCMFNAIHGEAGELPFFMAQPLTITFEDFIQWCWRKSGYAERHPRAARYIGYAWVFLWFSYCLPPFVEAQRAVGIMKADLGGEWAMQLAERHVEMLKGVTRA